MSIYYSKEHLGCHLYANDNNRIFTIVNYPKGSLTKRKYITLTLLAYIMEGEVEINYGINKNVHLKAGDFFLLPQNLSFMMKAIEDVIIITCLFNNGIPLCSQFSITQLVNYLPNSENQVFYSLKADKRLKIFMSLLLDCLSDGLGCIHYQEIKRSELFIYLRTGYTKEDLALLFCPILGKDMDFKDFILSHYKKISSIVEFAEKANMSLSTFNRYFKKTFNETAYKWLLTRKSEDILNDILKSNLTIAEISVKYKFSSPSYFSTFCKKNYGKTAIELRKDYFDLKT